MTTPFATRPAAATPPVPGRPVLRWVFRRDVNALTCEIAVNSAGACEVRVTPQWDSSLATCEGFGHVSEALHRHAEIASALRDIGWTDVEHVPVRTLAA